MGPGDVVLWQLPNWWECLVVAYGIWAAGAISSPVVAIYREPSCARWWPGSSPACVVTAASFRNVDHVALVGDACAAEGWEPRLKVVLRGTATGWTPFEEAVTGPPLIWPTTSTPTPRPWWA